MAPMSDDSRRSLVNRGDDPYPTDIKAEAVALVYETGNLSEAAKQMKERYPDRHPNRQLITRWFRQTDPEALTALSVERKEAFETGIMELGDKAREKLYEALDDLTPGAVGIPAGIAMDKALRLLEIEKRGGGGGQGRLAVLRMMKVLEEKMVSEGTIVEAIFLEGEMP